MYVVVYESLSRGVIRFDRCWGLLVTKGLQDGADRNGGLCVMV